VASDGNVRVFPGDHETVSIGDANPAREASHKGLHGTWFGVGGRLGKVQEFISCTFCLFCKTRCFRFLNDSTLWQQPFPPTPHI